jgi:fimbrial chaperone protein
VRRDLLPCFVSSAAAAALLVWAAPAAAAEVQVNPILVELSPSAPSALVALRNAGTEPARFEVQVRAWAQSPAGEMQLSATEDVVAFPPIVTIAPGEERNLRVGVATRFGEVEKSYRVFLQELAPPEKPGTPPHLRVLTRVGLPVFLAPSRAVEKTSIAELGVRGGRARFALRNDGTVRSRPSAVKVTALGADGKPVLERDLPAWYVLAGGVREYDVELAGDACARVREVSVSVALDERTLAAKTATPDGACAR